MQQQDTQIYNIAPTIRTDHKLLVFAIWTNELNGHTSLSNLKKKDRSTKEIYEYNKMDEES
jgi:hypothetical protein